MDISVLVPIYNVEKYVEKCLRSLFEQTKTDGVEFVIVNDSTPDNSMAVVHRVVSDYPNLTIKIIENEVNRGIAATRQIGLDAMTGDYTIHIDSDDWCESTMLEDLYNAAIVNNADIVCCDIFRNNLDVESYRKYNVPTSNGLECAELLLLDKLKGYLYAKFVRRSLYTLDSITFVKGIDLGEDLVVSVKLFAVAKKVTYIPKAYYHYVDRSSSLVNNCNIARLQEINILAIQELERFINMRGINKQLSQSLMDMKVRARLEMMMRSSIKERRSFVNLFPEATDYISSSNVNPRIKFGMIQASKGRIYIFNIIFCLARLKTLAIHFLKRGI